jgi:F1F0 ATPase subunit 2
MSYEVIYLGLALLGGMALGAFYFGGLWYTIQQIPTTTRPGILLIASMIVRVVVVLGAFILIMDGSWQRLLACMVGFFLMRQLLIKRWGSPRKEMMPVERSS